MWVGVKCFTEPVQLEEDEDEPRDGEPPGQYHQQPVPDEPLVEVAASARCANPGPDHETAVEDYEQSGFCFNRSHLTQPSWVTRNTLNTVFVQNTVSHGPLGQHDVVFVSLQIPNLPLDGCSSRP